MWPFFTLSEALTARRPDLIVLGFQEIVPLTAQQIVQADPEKKYESICLFLIST